MNRFAFLLFGFLVCATVAMAQDPSVLLAQDEGDYDESFDARGPDVDEEMETDSNLAPGDTTAKTPAVPAAPASAAEPAAASSADQIAALTKGITWLGHSGFLVQDSVNIYFDPFDVGENLPKADVVFITHDHADHFSPDDIARVSGPATTVVGPSAIQHKLPEGTNFMEIKFGDTFTIVGITVRVVRAYNTRPEYHLKGKGYVGYVIHQDGRSIYDAGDTDLIPEMKAIKADVAFLPVGGRFTMDATEAAKAANLIRPKVAIPMHYGKLIGTDANAQAFKKLSEVPVVIMKPQPYGPAKHAPAGKPVNQGEKQEGK